MEKHISHFLFSCLLLLCGIQTVFAADNPRELVVGAKNTVADGFTGTTSIFSEATKHPLSIAAEIITGTVKDDNGDPLVGASVVVQGTTKGALTDENGNFKIELSSADSKGNFVVSFVGYEKQVVAIAGRTSINIVLKEEGALEAVVVVGFATQKKATVTGAIASIGTKDLLQSPVANLSNSLAGRMAGLFAVQGSGEPGNDASTLRIRGVGTFSGAADPLIMVDGIEVSNYNNLDPNEIDNISILKDASATAVYGIRGANGVVLITTRRGKTGKPQLSYTANVAVTDFTALRKNLGSYDYARLWNEALKNDAYISGAVYTPKFTTEQLDKYKTGSDPILYPDTDWFALVMKQQTSQTQHNLNISGGTEKVKYFVSGGFFKQSGLFNGDLVPDFDANRVYNRYNFRSNFNFDITKRLRMSMDISSQSENISGSNATTVRLIENLSRANPLTSPGVVDGKIVNIPGLGITTNPLAALFAEGYKKQFKNFLQGSTRIDYDLDFITKGLSVHGLANYQNNNTEDQISRRNLVQYNAVGLPNGTINYVPQSLETPFTFSQNIEKNRRTYAEFGIDYKRVFGQHSVSALINYNQTKRYDPKLAFLIPNGYQGVVGRATYNYKRKYLAEYTFGYNGTENFAPGQRFGFFPAYSLGWVVSEEKFFPKNKVITSLKIRGSSGEVGNDRIGGDRFLYRPSSFTQGNGATTLLPITQTAGSSAPLAYQGNRGYGYNFGEVGSNFNNYATVIEGKLGNPVVTWERAIKQNIGAEISFWKGKIAVTADYFVENRDNILANLGTAPLSFGGNLPAYNLGKMKNSGFDGDITYNEQIRNVGFWVKGNFTYARNIVEFQDEVTKTFSYQNRTGQPFNQVFGLIADGLYNTWDEVNDAKRPVSAWNNNKIQPGDIKYRDINGDGRVNVDDQVPIGYTNFPEKIFGISFGASYKGFDCSFLLQGATNVSLTYNRRHNRGWFESSGAVDYLVNSWSQERYDQGLPIWLPLLSEGDVNNKHNYQSSTYWTRDASYLRFKNLELGYTFSKGILSKVGLSSIRAYVSGNNLYTWSSTFPGIDPELPPGPNNEEPYPLTRTFNAGLNIKF
jgi:TonB-linked SusC/RagA family outer membrane protein